MISRSSYPCHLLVTGRTGIGKTHLINSILSNLNQCFKIKHRIINSTYLYQQNEGDTEQLLDSIFLDASSSSPFILVFEEIDTIMLNPDHDQIGYIEKRVSNHFQKLLERNSDSKRTGVRECVFVIGITSRSDAMNPCFFNAGRFDSVVNLHVPTPLQRQKILSICMNRFPSWSNHLNHYQQLSRDLGDLTHGFVGADLQNLCKEAVVQRLKRDLQVEEFSINKDLVIEKIDFEQAMELVKPSSLNEFKLPRFEPISFNEIGGLGDVIQQLKTTILTPILNSDALNRIGVKPPSGILLYGPPGNGKSLIARAIASASPNINFISVQSTDIIDPVVGASEKNLAKLFRVLRDSAPCILFLDQVEVLARVRGFDTSSEQSSDRLLSSLLTEIDGIYTKSNNATTIILAATTRMDMLDPAILRPGRFDYHIMIPNPTQPGRLEILQKLTKSMPLGDDVDLQQISQQTDSFSGADLSNLCKETALLALRNNINTPHLIMDHFLQCLKSIKPTSQINENQENEDQYSDDNIDNGESDLE
eukprot:gene4781-5962_t